MAPSAAHHSSTGKDRSLLLRIIVVIAALVFGIVMVWHGLTDAHEARASEHWPETDGKILSHAVHRHDHTRNPDTFEPIVGYEYCVGGQVYKDSRIAWYAERFDNEQEAYRFMQERYPIGKTVRVHYDSAHPHHACLIPGGGKRAMAPVFAGGMMMVVLVVVFGLYTVRRRRQGAAGGEI